jgi:MFS family permease
MMALEFAVRGSWGPVLSARLLGPLGMSGKQVGWIYAMYPLTCIAAPLVAGQIVDRWIPTEWFLAGAHFASGLALLAAARATSFRWLLLLIGIHCLFFSPTLGLVNSLTFAHLTNPKVEYFWVRVWSSVAWMSVGCLLTAWRWSGKFIYRGSDALLLAAVLSFVMAAFCVTCVPHTPPSGGSNWAAAWDPLVKLLSNRSVLALLGISLVATTQLQFYYIGTAPFLERIGIRHASVPAIMTVAQVAEVVATAKAAPWVLSHLGYQWTLALGPLLWALMYLAYVAQRPRWLVVAAMALHGFAFAFFFDAAIVYMNQVAPAAIRGTAQSLHIVVTLGLGLFLGTQFTGFVLDRCRIEGGYRWRAVFLTPCITLVLCALAFVIYFVEQ